MGGSSETRGKRDVLAVARISRAIHHSCEEIDARVKSPRQAHCAPLHLSAWRPPRPLTGGGIEVVGRDLQSVGRRHPGHHHTLLLRPRCLPVPGGRPNPRYAITPQYFATSHARSSSASSPPTQAMNDNPAGQPATV